VLLLSPPHVQPAPVEPPATTLISCPPRAMSVRGCGDNGSSITDVSSSGSLSTLPNLSNAGVKLVLVSTRMVSAFGLGDGLGFGGICSVGVLLKVC